MDIEKIRSFVGDLPENALEIVDSFVGEHLALFVPAVGQCPYSISKDHTHPAYSFVLTFDSNLEVAASDRDKFLVDKGALIGMSPDFKHHEEESEEFSRYYAIMIATPYFNEVLALYNIESNPHYNFTVAFPAKDFLPYLREFMMESCSDTSVSRVKLAALETLITHRVVEAFHPVNENHREAEVHERIEIDRAVEFIHSSFGRKVSVEEIASEVCLSPSHLSHIFKKEVGKTVMGYLTEVRLQNARKLLLLKKYSISDIAYQCGFSSPSHLSQSFKNHFGISPREVLKST